MAGTLQALILRPPITGNVILRRRSQLPSAAQCPFFYHSSNATPFLWKLHSVARTPIVGASAQFRQGNDNGENGFSRASSSDWGKPLAKFVADNFLPIALVSGVLLGLANPSLGCVADKYYLSKFSSFGIFIISGLTLRSDEIGAAAEAWPVGLFGLVSILFITPLFSKIILLLKLQPQEFVTDFWLQQDSPYLALAGGNSALALAMTVISNLLGILIIPFSISNLIASGVGVSVPTKQLLRSLVLTLLVPLILGKVAREFSRGLADFVDGNRQALAMISAILLGLVPWIQVSRSRSLLLMVKPEIFLVAVMMGALLHTVLFAFNALVIQAISLISDSKSTFTKKENARALLLVASQKTLPVMVAVIEQLRGSLGESGLLILPCVAAHLNQIIIDSFLVSLWKQKEDAFDNAKVA